MDENKIGLIESDTQYFVVFGTPNIPAQMYGSLNPKLSEHTKVGLLQA